MLHAHNEMRVDTEAVNDFVGRSIDKIQELPTNGGLTALPPPPLAGFFAYTSFTGWLRP